MRSESRLRRVPVDYDTTWIREAMLPFDAYAVGTIVPVAFESYGRILHPAWTRTGSAVRWDTVAAWSGGIVHALAQFDPLARPRGGTISAPPFDRRPDDGELPRHVLIALCDTLAAHTTTPEACFAGLWEGRVLLEPGIRTLRLPLPERSHLVFEGPLAAIGDAGWTNYDGTVVRQAPSIMWPADRAWFVSTDVDQDSTYIGGSSGLLAALTANPCLEVWPAMPTDPITFDSDSINPL